jgi:hypothetical protein
MPSVALSNEKWGQLMFVLANAEGKGVTWALVNPLMMEIGEQLRQQTPSKQTGIKLDANGQELRHE